MRSALGRTHVFEAPDVSRETHNRQNAGRAHSPNSPPLKRTTRPRHARYTSHTVKPVSRDQRQAPTVDATSAPSLAPAPPASLTLDQALVPFAPANVKAFAEAHPASLVGAAKSSLESNIVDHPTGLFLSAGGHQFRSFWTRDFCWAIPGLLAIGRGDVVRDHLQLLCDTIREDGLLPRAVDTMNPKTRVVRATLAYAVGLRWPQKAQTGPLKPEYIEQNGHPVIDGNALAILGALTYADATGDHAFLTKNAAVLEKVLGFYTKRTDATDGLIVQPGFADWQDSVRRSGKTLYTNVLWAAVLQRLADRQLFGVTSAKADRVRASIAATFFDSDTGLFRSVEGAPQISLDGNLLAIELGIVQGDEAQALYASLKNHQLWSMADGIPGSVTTPDYSRVDLNWTMMLAGLNHYHDRIAWSWLIALSAKTAARMGEPDEAKRILEALATYVDRDKIVSEIYDPTRQMRPWQRWLYHSETPFSWGAAMTLDAADFIERQSATEESRAASTDRRP